MKFFLSLLFVFFPFIATAEATGGYSYGFGDDIIGVGVVVVLVIVVVAFIIFKHYLQTPQIKQCRLFDHCVSRASLL